MSRLHCARYVIPLHRPWWSVAWRALQLRWLRHCRQCVIEERDGYIAKGMPIGEKYLANCADAVARYDAQISLFEIHS